MLFSLYAVLTAFYAVIFSLYAVLFLLCAVANSLYAVLFSLCTEVKSLYAVPFSCKAFSCYTRCFFHYVRWLFHYTRCFFHYTHGTSFSLDLKRGQLRMEVKMAATTRIPQLILKKLSLGHLTELFRRDNNTTDITSRALVDMMNLQLQSCWCVTTPKLQTPQILLRKDLHCKLVSILISLNVLWSRNI